MNLFRKSLTVNPDAVVATYGHLFFRVSAGLMIFYVHGCHKLEGWIGYLRRGASWELLQEVEGMHFPAPYAGAVAATLIQFICSLFIVAGLLTRINAVLLLGALGGAVSQNLLAGLHLNSHLCTSSWSSRWRSLGVERFHSMRNCKKQPSPNKKLQR